MSPRRPKRWVWFLLVAVLLVCLAALGLNRTKRVSATEWRWAKERVTLDYCVKHNLGGYTARITPFKDSWGLGRLRITILNGAEEVHTFEGNELTVFVQADDVLYYEDHSGPSAPANELVAHDLKARKELWRCVLKSNPPDLYSSNWQSTNIEVAGDAILVFTAASYGRCIEYVDRKSGRTVGYRKLPPDHSVWD